MFVFLVYMIIQLFIVLSRGEKRILLFFLQNSEKKTPLPGKEKAEHEKYG